MSPSPDPPTAMGNSPWTSTVSSEGELPSSSAMRGRGARVREGGAVPARRDPAAAHDPHVRTAGAINLEVDRAFVAGSRGVLPGGPGRAVPALHRGRQTRSDSAADRPDVCRTRAPYAEEGQRRVDAALHDDRLAGAIEDPHEATRPRQEHLVCGGMSPPEVLPDPKRSYRRGPTRTRPSGASAGPRRRLTRTPRHRLARRSERTGWPLPTPRERPGCTP